MIVCEKLTKLFDANSGIKEMDLQFTPGIIGYNGAGKTTLLNCIEWFYKLPYSNFRVKRKWSQKQKKF